MSTPRASAPSEGLHRPVPDSLRAVGALSAAAALRARRPSHRVRLTLDLLVVAGVLAFALLLATAGPATARTTQPAPAATTTAARTEDPTVPGAEDPAAPTSDPAAPSEAPTVPDADDPAAPSGDPAAPTSDPAAGEDPETVAQPEYPPPTVRACAPCYERRPPGPTRLGTSASPAEASGTPGPVAAARAQVQPRPAAAFQLPATGSSVPTVAVTGALLLALGLVLRAATRHELTR